MEECSVQVPATDAGTENKSTYYDTSATVPHPKGKGKESQDVNDADTSSMPTNDDACGEDIDLGSCTSRANGDGPSDQACNRIEKREKQAEAYERCVASIFAFRQVLISA